MIHLRLKTLPSFFNFSVLMFALNCLPLAAHAGDQHNCTITGVGVFSASGGWYLQCTGGERSNIPSCAGTGTQWAMQWSAPASKETYALAMAAWLSANPVRLNGTGTCDPSFIGRESLNGIERFGM